MLDSLTVENILADCMTRIELFNKKHNGKAFGKVVTIHTNGIDGGGMSTFGKRVRILQGDRYECHEGYLYVHHAGRERDPEYRKTMETERVSFVPYESIVSIECEPKAYV